MRELFVLLAHLCKTLVTLCRRGGLYAVAAESLAVKHQLQVMDRSGRRAPRLTPWDRLVFGLCAWLHSDKAAGEVRCHSALQRYAVSPSLGAV